MGGPRDHAARAPLFLALAITLLVWSSGFTAIRHAVRGFPPASLALLRFLIASLVLALITLPTRRVVLRKLPRRDVIGFLVAGFVTIPAYHIALNAGERTVSAGAASLLINTGPIWTALIAMAFLGERFGAREWLGTAFAFAGAVIVSVGAAGGIRFEGDVGFVMIAALAQAAFFVISKGFLTRYRPLETTCFTIWMGTAYLLPFIPELWRAMPHASRAEIGSAIYLGVAPGAIGYVCWTYVLSRMPASRASTLLYLIPPLAYLIGWIGLGERPGLTALLGGLPILVGLMLVNAGPEATPTGRRASSPPEAPPAP